MSCLTASVKAPVLYPLKPCKEDTASMTLGCLVKDYFPDPVTVTWYSDSLNMNTTNFPALSSELKVTTSQLTTWGKSAKHFTCHVTHALSSFSRNLTIPGKQGWAGYSYSKRKQGQSRKGLSCISVTGQGCGRHPGGGA